MTGSHERLLRARSVTDGEPRWLLDARLESYRALVARPLPTGDGHVSAAAIDRILRNQAAADERGRRPEATVGARFGAGTEGEAVFRRALEALERRGVLFTDMATALREHAALVEPYFDRVIPVSGDPFASLNTAVWSGGSFVFIPPGVEADVPLLARTRLHGLNAGPFERTLIVAGEGSTVHYLDGCSAPVYTADPLHAPVVEIVVERGADVTCTTIQNWSSNVSNFATRRARVEADGHLTLIDTNIGGRHTTARPVIWLAGPRATGEVSSVAYAGAGQRQDTGATIVHAAPATTSSVVARSVSRDGGTTDHRSLIRVADDAHGCSSEVRSDALLLDGDSTGLIDPRTAIGASDARITQDTTVSTVADQQLFYLMSRGLPYDEAVGLVVNGFIEPVTRALPMEYGVELSRLVELQLEGGVG